jgi:hypothetical protein
MTTIGLMTHVMISPFCVTIGNDGLDTHMITLYRIYDHTTQNILANAIPTLEQAHEVLHFLQQDAPGNELEIESYTKSSVKGLGRDPDLH